MLGEWSGEQAPLVRVSLLVKCITAQIFNMHNNTKRISWHIYFLNDLQRFGCYRIKVWLIRRDFQAMSILRVSSIWLKDINQFKICILIHS